jgi:hypothetical protein
MAAVAAVIDQAANNLLAPRRAVAADEDKRLSGRATPGALENFRLDDSDGHAMKPFATLRPSLSSPMLHNQVLTRLKTNTRMVELPRQAL